MAGISKRVGWHTFRYTFSSLLALLKTNLIVQKELPRHADIQTTMRYTLHPDCRRCQAGSTVEDGRSATERPDCIKGKVLWTNVDFSELSNLGQVLWNDGRGAQI